MKHVNVDQKIQDAPDIVWKSLQGKSSQTEKNLAEAEEKKMIAELARKALEDNLRKGKAEADMAETNAQIAKVKLAKDVYDLAQKVKGANTIVKFSPNGSITALPAPPGYDYDALSVHVQQALLPPAGEAKPISDQPADPPSSFDQPSTS